MPRLKPVLKYPRLSTALLIPGNILASAPVQAFGKSGVVRLLPGWTCLGWTFASHTPKKAVVVFEKKECRPAAFHNHLGPGIYWHPTEPADMTIELESEFPVIPCYKEGDPIEPPSELAAQLARR